MIKALAFDMDGTLVDSERIHWEAWRVCCINHGVKPYVYEEFVRFVGVSDESMADEIIELNHLTMSVEDLVSEKQQTYLKLIPQIKLLPGVKTILQRFQERYRLAITSSSPRIELLRILEHHGLTDFFELVVGGDMVERKKPEPDIYVLATRLLNLLPEECVAFEDSQSGLHAAKTAGLVAVAIPHGLSEGHDFSRADLVVSQIDEVTDDLLKTLEYTR